MKRPVRRRPPTSKGALSGASDPRLPPGLRSGYERKIALEILGRGLDLLYETRRLKYVAAPKTYIADFELPNGILVEAKGWFKPSDRTKMLAVKAQHPDLDIRLLFQRAKNTLNKNSETTYGEWADKHGFKWAEGSIPDGWYVDSASHQLARRKRSRGRPRGTHLRGHGGTVVDRPWCGAGDDRRSAPNVLARALVRHR